MNWDRQDDPCLKPQCGARKQGNIRREIALEKTKTGFVYWPRHDAIPDEFAVIPTADTIDGPMTNK